MEANLPIGALTIGALALLLSVSMASAENLPVENIRLPAGFKIEVFADDVPGARSLAQAPGGTIFVGTRSGDSVRAVLDHDGDHRADEIVTIARGLNRPNGVAMRAGALYVAEIGRVLRFDNIEARLHNPPQPAIITNDLPKRRHHGWKFIRFGPDGKLYVPIGAPCNICAAPKPFSTILRMNPDGSEVETYAEGVRNSVGFDWHPETAELWFSDNGRDMLGDDLPPDELNHAPRAGMHFGYPYCHGGDIPDPEFGEVADCSRFSPPAVRLGPHVAALGLRFYTGAMFPPQYQGQIFIAEHGSWNRSKKSGYRISLVRLENGKPVSYEPFAEGWLDGEQVWGRPVDLMIMPDGALLVSDDHAGAIYRISYAP
ncbi:MAG: sorbosone dehydrogenase family protein [Rhodospirillaceae bacterium]|nr:sorbosone dehydrogenase family protein [Rhodospirillaceae bacterium]